MRSRNSGSAAPPSERTISSTSPRSSSGSSRCWARSSAGVGWASEPELRPQRGCYVMKPIITENRDLLAASIRSVLRFRQTEARLRESEELFRATVEQAAVGLGHLTLDGQWT